MLVMIILFTVISLLMAPAMYFYSSYDGYNGAAKGYSKLSLGNLGYSSTQCQISPWDLKQLNIFCPYGNIGSV